MTENKKVIDIIAVETDDGFYISSNLSDYGSSKLDYYIINGGNSKETYHPRWRFIPEKLTSLQQEVTGKTINRRYELINKELSSDKIPEVLKYDEVYEDGDLINEFASVISLYEYESDTEPPSLEDIPFSLRVVLKIDKLDLHEPFSYKVIEDSMWGSKKTKITEKDIKISLLDQIIFPEIVKTNRPCYLTSKETYNIVRQHVKDNIISKNAEITSDYDFCFTVKKKIRLSEPEKYTVDVNNSVFRKRKRKSKYETRYKTDRYVEVFEMTHSEKGYQGYTIIKGFKGENQTDLKEKIDSYLESLMEFINRPLVDCPKCEGRGVLLDFQTEEERRE